MTDEGLPGAWAGVFWGVMLRGGADLKETGATARSTDEASSPGPTGGGECGVGVVTGAWQQQATA
jgi:hypothetical protein